MVNKICGGFTSSILLLLFVFFSVNCHHYTFNPNLPSDIEKIAIPTFKNDTFQYGLETELTSRVVDEFISDGTLDIVDKGKADAILWGTVKTYKLEPVAFDINEVVKEYRMVVRLSLSFEDNSSQEMFWEDEEISESISFYPTGSGNIVSETEALNEISDYLATDVVRLVVEGWW